MKKRLSQVEFDLINYKSQIGKAFGGARTKGNPKVRRPFSRRHLIHLILKSSKAKGTHSFLHACNKKTVDSLVKSLASKFGVEIRDYVNVGNHLHLLVKCNHRVYLSRFLKSLTGLLPRKIFNCEKGHPLGFTFWDGRPFTKIVAEGFKPFQIIRKYFDKNRWQVLKRVEGFDFYPQVNST